MPDLNHKFQAGKMNKDLDERLVPNGEYRDALNVQVATSDVSDIGTLQNILGNLNISSESFIDPVTGNIMDETVLDTYGFYCVGSIADEKNDKLYWLVSGVGVDFIAEYDYNTKKVHPIVVDTFQANVLPGDDGRVLNFDKGFLITGINIMEETIFWTDNNTEPKRVNIPQIRLGTVDFLTHTVFYVPNPDKVSPIPFVAAGDLQEEHITVIRKGPNTAPKLEMKNTKVGDVDLDSISGEITTTYSESLISLWDAATGTYVTGPVSLFFDTNPDFKKGDFLDIESMDSVTGSSKKRKITVEIIDDPILLTSGPNAGKLEFQVEVRSWDTNIDLDNEDFNVTLQQDSSLFKFRFPRFGYRYKYKDGEYSAFSPFSEIAFLPGEFDYLPKEGYNLAMVNTLRALGVCDFVDERYIPEDVISIDILYKESNSPAVYSIKTVDRLPLDPTDYDSWNAVTLTTTRDVSAIPPIQTYGYVNIKSEMIHSILPDNQLLRPWDNVPKKALAQEIIGNRIVYGNYLQNYNLSSSHTQNPSALTNVTLQRSKNIEVDLKVVLKQKDVALSGAITEELDAGKAYTYASAKTIKSLRTYQLGVIYIDEFGRETPVFSSSKDSRHTISVKKDSAAFPTKLAAQIHSPQPDFAKNFKFLVKETSSEYYNLAMDRWYNADDGNIWITFPSADRNKVDLETFLILKKAHKEDRAVTDLARYKILDIKNEAPRFVKTRRTPIRTINDGFTDSSNTIPIFMDGGNEDIEFPFTGGRFIDIHEKMVGSVIDAFESEVGSAYPFQFRIVSAEGASKWYDIQSFESRLSGSETYWRIIATKNFGDDMAITTPFNVEVNPAEPAYGNCKIEFIKREEKNLPEFDGRFFVKILKDAALQENILGYLSYTGDWSSSASVKSQYINAYSEAGDYDLNANPANWYGCNPMRISVDENTNDTGYGAPSWNGEGQAYWDQAGNTEEGGSESSGWFIDSIEAFREYRYTNAYSRSRNVAEGGQPGDSYLADWGTPPTPGNPNPYWYIRDRMQANSIPNPFYDISGVEIHPVAHIAPTQTQNLSTFITHGGSETGNPEINDAFKNTYGGYGWDAPYKQLQLIGDLGNWYAKDETGAHVYANGAGGNWNNYLGISNVNSLVLDNSANNGNAIPRIRAAASYSGGKIIPASGIDKDNSIIHLSYAGMGFENKSAEDLDDNPMTNLNDRSSFENYQDAAAAINHVDELFFITAITTPGTVWRWKEDPGQVMYQTKIGPPAAGDINNNEWDVSQRDPRDNGMGVRLWNYAKIADYMTTHRMEFFVGNNASQTEYIPHFASQGIQNYGLKWPNWMTYANSISNWVAWGALARTSGGTGTSNLNHKEYWMLLENSPKAFPKMHQQGFWPMYTQDWNDASCSRRRFTIHAKALANSDLGTTGIEPLGSIGPYYYLPTNPTSNAPHFDETGEALDPSHANVVNNIAPGIRPDGIYSGKENVVNYNFNGVSNIKKIPSKKMIDGTHVVGTDNVTPAPGSVTWQIMEKYELNSGAGDAGYFTSNPGVWETEPKDDLGLEVYHEVGQIYPTELNEETLEQFFGPIHTDLSRNSKVTCWAAGGGFITLSTAATDDIRIGGAWFDVASGIVLIQLIDIFGTPLSGSTSTLPPTGSRLIFTRADGSTTEVNVKTGGGTLGGGLFEVHKDTHNYQVTLPWFNAYSFGNGVESNRIRDDYNQITIDKGPKVSTVLEEPYIEERRSSGFIWSGIFNSLSGVNNLNQFIQAEKITKDLNPIHGSIQKLFARNTDLVTLCEDKVFKILANKDALYNADGNANLTASQNVLGQTVPFSGDHGISKNPESFAADAYRLYFSDRTRGSILRLSQDGITPISSYGMTNWFADNLSESNRIIGSFDDKKKEYNISLSYYNQTVYPIRIMGTRKHASSPVFPSARLRVADWVASKFHVGDEIVGPGIPIGATIVEKTDLWGGVWEIKISHVPQPLDISTLGNHVCGDPDCLLFWWNSYVTVYTESPMDPVTLSYSEINKGWPSFKSFNYEEALSLNNDYFTFKGGQLHQHHVNDIHNNFYGEQYDSSVEVLFNEGPGIVKSFQSLDYEGSQSKVTSDGGLNEMSNSGEYWDNYDKLGWYVDNMYTDLQELEPAEFKNKEGKWFSAIKGVATEWLDDGKAGNIDTHEFSYQGIDEAGAITVLDGGYTSWDCIPSTGGCAGIYPIYSTIMPTWTSSTTWHCDWPWDNPQVPLANWFYEDVDGNYYGPSSGEGWVNNAQTYPNNSISLIGMTDLTLIQQQAGVQADSINIVDWYLTSGSTGSMSYTTSLNQWGYTQHSITPTTIEELIIWFRDNIDSTAFFVGMTNSQWATALLGGPWVTSTTFFLAGAGSRGCLSPCGANSNPNGSCVEIQDLTGAYPDKSTCETDPRSACSDLCVTPNVVTAHPTDASMPDCGDGTAAVEVYLAGTAVSWTVKYVDASGGVTMDNTTYNYNGYSNPTPNLMQGTYNAVVTDDLGCEEVVEFVIDCTATTPCSSSNPHDFDPIFLTDPAWDKNINDCWLAANSFGNIADSGKIKISNNNLTPPATMWGVNIYSVVSGVSTMILGSNWIYPGDAITIDGLEAGDYEYEIRDDQPCTYPPVPFTLNCTPVTPCDSPTIPSGGYSTTNATSNDGCTTDNGDGAHEITTVNLDPGSSTYTVQYYTISTSTWGTGVAVPIGPLLGPAPGNVSLVTPIGYYNLSSFLTTGQNYAVVIEDDQGCELIETFTVDCTSTVNNPCAGYTSSSGPTFHDATTDATSNDCGVYDNGDGKHTVLDVSLQPTANWWSVEYFTGPNGTGTSLTASPLPQYNPTDTMVTHSSATGLGAGDYSVVIADSLGCEAVYNFTIGCDDGVDRGQCSPPYTTWVSGVAYPDGDAVEHNGEYFLSQPSVWVGNAGNVNIAPDQVGSYFSPCENPTQWCYCGNATTWVVGNALSYVGGNVVTYNGSCWIHNGDISGQSIGNIYYPGIYTTGNYDPINPWVLCSNPS